MFFSNIFAFLFSFFGNINYTIYFFVWRRDLNTGLFDIWQLSCITHFWRIWWNEMRWDVMRWSALIVAPTARLTFSFDSSDMTEDEAMDSEEVDRCRMAGLERNVETDLPKLGCCYEQQTKQKMIVPLLLLYKRSGRGVQEEVLAFFCSGRGRGGLRTSRLRLDGWGRRHDRKLWQLIVYINITKHHSSLKLRLNLFSYN